MSRRPVKLESSGSSLAISAKPSLIAVPTLSMFNSTSGISSITARSQNERTTEVSEVSSSTAKHRVSELLPAEYSRNSDDRPITAAPAIHPPAWIR